MSPTVDSERAALYEIMRQASYLSLNAAHRQLIESTVTKALHDLPEQEVPITEPEEVRRARAEAITKRWMLDGWYVDDPRDREYGQRMLDQAYAAIDALSELGHLRATDE